MGLFLYDVPFMRIWKSKEDILWIGLIVIISAVSLYISPFLIIPYAIFFVAYALRIFLASKRLNFVGTALGILAYVILFVETINLGGTKSLILIASLFLFMLGSEFTVKAKLSRTRILLAYDFLPVFLIVLSPIFLIFTLSILRIPVALKTRGLKFVGMAETSLLLIVTIIILVFYVMKL